VLRRDDTFGEVIVAGEGSAAGGGDASLMEEVFEGDLALTPAPPGAAALGSFGEVADGNRAVVADFFEYAPDVIATFVGELLDAPVGVLLHTMPEEVKELDRDKAGGMAPVLEEVAALVGVVVEELRRVGAEARKEGQIVRSDEHVDRVELQHTDAVEDAAQVGGHDASSARARISEALGGECDLAGGLVGDATHGLNCEW